MKYVIEFNIPSKNLREKIWRSHIPPLVPLDKNIDFVKLASDFQFSGSHIKSAVILACSRAALRNDPNRIVTQLDFENAANQQLSKILTSTKEIDQVKHF
eukprot:Anaeramoba_ignava/c20962_g2_i1.p2 GENE.c20962_g2_i1~~c20962_g2_i1.p2  ORF type:complete len:100 (-),score=33.30 c20962_g2_i1:39-338(-)